MRIDVSEVKSFKTCARKWKISSRNAYHMRPKETPKQFALGTLFHESLHALYLGAPLERVMQTVRKEMSMENDQALLAMIPGYANNVLPEDLDKYVVLDIEHKFEMRAGRVYEKFTKCPSEEVPDELWDIDFCGSIDMIAYCPEDNCIYGFEHKTAKDFRPTSYLWMDEQPRLYFIALQQYINQYNFKQLAKWNEECSKAKCADSMPLRPRPVKVGGVYLNEVKKLLRQFQYNRTKCTYEFDDLCNFVVAFCNKAIAIKRAVNSNSYACPEPDYFKCKMCEFSEVCETYMYSDIPKALLLDDWKDQFIEREVDHLDEKVERENTREEQK